MEANYARFFDSLKNQDYTNYRVILITNGRDLMEEVGGYVERNVPHLGEGRNFIMGVNQKHIGELETRNRNIAQFCRKNEIVLDVSIDGAFIGTQAFKFISAVFK